MEVENIERRELMVLLEASHTTSEQVSSQRQTHAYKTGLFRNTFFLLLHICHHYLPNHPPSMASMWPLTYAPPLPHRYTAAAMKSSVLPHLPAGIRSLMLRSRSGLSNSGIFISVTTYPGAIALTKMCLGPSSTAKFFARSTVKASS